MFIVDFFDKLLHFIENYPLTGMISIFWLFFYVEVPRYYLLDSFVILYRKIRHKYYARRYYTARLKLYTTQPFVSIIVPGKNEGEHIYKLATSLREQTYRNFEIIIIDDGSDDYTPIICNDLYDAGYIDLFLRNPERGGKASAANMGLYYAKGKYIVHLDADSSLDRDAIENILIPFFYDTRIKAVGGCVKVRNYDKNICTGLQAIEYLETIMVGRMVTSTLNVYRIISGAFGAFDAAMLRQVGGWDVGPGLDGDITQKFRKSGARIDFAEKAICLTNVPTKFINLLNQRSRWSKSLIRFRMRKHTDVLMPNENFNFYNFISNMENILFNFLFDVLWVIYMVTLIANNQSFIIELLFLKFVLMFFFGIFSFLMVLWVTERRKDEWRLILMTPLMFLYTGLFLRWVRVRAYILEIFFFSSYKDPWNPKKTSDMARYNKI